MCLCMYVCAYCRDHCIFTIGIPCHDRPIPAYSLLRLMCANSVAKPKQRWRPFVSPGYVIKLAVMQ